jgi:toxin FitB
MILLDTNVLSALMRSTPDLAVVRWLDQQPRTSVWTTAVTVFEIRLGLNILPAGKRKASLLAAFDHILKELLEQRIAPFDAAAATAAAALTATRQKAGRPGELRDTMIAGITLATRATIATRNAKHFEDISASVINPWNS